MEGLCGYGQLKAIRGLQRLRVERLHRLGGEAFADAREIHHGEQVPSTETRNGWKKGWKFNHLVGKGVGVEGWRLMQVEGDETKNRVCVCVCCLCVVLGLFLYVCLFNMCWDKRISWRSAIGMTIESEVRGEKGHLVALWVSSTETRRKTSVFLWSG